MGFLRYFQTVRHLRLRQVWYRAWRPLQRRFYKEKAVPDGAIRAAMSRQNVALQAFKPHDVFEPSANSFSFLNLTAVYPAAIDWNEPRHGLLWAFHLNYFGWLEDESVAADARRATVRQYVGAAQSLTVGQSAYTISLRAIAWIRFFLRHGTGNDAAAVKLLYQHLIRLHRFPEYELDGNHLWENGCALLAGGLYFGDEDFYKKGIAILKETLRDQLAADGMHLEASPMYHSLLLHRLLICIELHRKLRPDEEVPEFITSAAERMLGWLKGFSFNDGTWAMVNDSAPEMAVSANDLEALAVALGIHALPVSPQSHYRVFKNEAFELVVDVGSITPPWQPGHHHADTLNFCLNSGGMPVIVDTGISTYDPSGLRGFQRSTGAHNTITINGESSSDVWKSFRIGRRAQVSILQDDATCIEAQHNGYRQKGITHVRNIRFGVDKIIIEDHLKGLKRQKGLLHLHFHPDIEIKRCDENRYLARDLLIVIEKAAFVEQETYTFAAGFNRTREAKRLVIEVTAYTTTTIERLNTSNAD